MDNSNTPRFIRKTDQTLPKASAARFGSKKGGPKHEFENSALNSQITSVEVKNSVTNL